MKTISVFDAAISDYNLGNQIIMEGVNKHLKEVFPDDFFFKLPFMEITSHTVGYIKRSDLVLLGGTNALTSRMERYKQWGINLRNSIHIKDVILMGVGWWQYQSKESTYTKVLLNRVLSTRFLHSVRDSYTEKKLRQIGFKNVLNTACPSMWDLTPELCVKIKKGKSSEVVMTLTDYSQNLGRDKQIFDVLKKNYSRVYVWIQGPGDKSYIEMLGKKNEYILLSPDIKALDHILENDDIDYVGTRLHAGIRALQFGRRTIIIAIDNRATELNADFNIPIVQQDKVEQLDELINSQFETRINLPLKNISSWKKQFMGERC